MIPLELTALRQPEIHGSAEIVYIYILTSLVLIHVARNSLGQSIHVPTEPYEIETVSCAEKRRPNQCRPPADWEPATRITSAGKWPCPQQDALRRRFPVCTISRRGTKRALPASQSEMGQQRASCFCSIIVECNSNTISVITCY